MIQVCEIAESKLACQLLRYLFHHQLFFRISEGLWNGQFDQKLSLFSHLLILFSHLLVELLIKSLLNYCFLLCSELTSVLISL